MAEQTEDDAAFFEQALAESRAADPMERAGYVQLPDRCKEQLVWQVSQSLANSKLFLSVLNAVLPALQPGKFTDKQFPPDKSSLIRFWELADIGAQIEWEDFKWVRLSESFSELRVFDNIDPGDIKQGSLGDCYFLSTLSALAETPDRIRRLFITQTVEESAQYKVIMMEMGHWKEYVIDDYMPMKSETELAFSGPKIEKGVVEMWVLLLEKAWAKKFGCYYDIQAGFAEEALTDLTGAPCKIVSRNDQLWWQEIVSADKRNFIITAGCVGTGVAQEDKAKYASLGLIVDHAYAVISAREILVAGRMERLLKIRNPWGHVEWIGDWADNSTKWTEAAKKEVEFSNADDGTFWMSFDDFQKYFESCTICMMDESYWTQSLAMDQTKNEEFSVIEMTSADENDLYFMTCQVDERRLGGIEGGYSYSPCRMIAVRCSDTGELEYISSKASVSTRDTWMHLRLTPGKYLIYVDFEWKSDVTDLFGVSVYSTSQVQPRDVTAENNSYLERCFTAQYLNTCQLTNTAVSGVFRYRTYKLSGRSPSGDLLPGLYFDYFENLSESERLLISVKHTPWDNMHLIHVPTEDRGQFQLQLDPGSSRVVIKKQKRLQDRHGFKVFLKKVFVPVR